MPVSMDVSFRINGSDWPNAGIRSGIATAATPLRFAAKPVSRA